MSGLKIPTPSLMAYMFIPHEVKEAIPFNSSFKEPTPITSIISPGLLRVPNSGPSFPIAATTMIPFSITS